MSAADKNDPIPFTLPEAKAILAFPLVARIMARTRTINSRDWDIPYLAGYSKDGRTIYIDRSLAEWTWQRQIRPTKPHLILHEQSEKSIADAIAEAQGRELERLLILLRMAHADDQVYYHCHGVATCIEEYSVTMQYGPDGCDSYNGFMKGQIMRAGDERLRRVPADLDMLPYQGSDRQDVRLRAEMEAKMAA